MEQQRQAQLDRQQQRQQQQKQQQAAANKNAAPKGMERSYLIFSNVTLMVAWARVLRVVYRSGVFSKIMEASTFTMTMQENTCLRLLTPALHLALALSFMEVFNAGAGLTRSKVHLTMLFCSVRAVMEALVAPNLTNCNSQAHIFTVTCWSLGETIRFGCFVLDLLVPGGRLAKTVRYTVGPIMFPLGALGELGMIATYAKETKHWYWLGLACLTWPLGIYVLMKQLLQQRHKFLTKSTPTNNNTSVENDDKSVKTTKTGAKIKAV